MNFRRISLVTGLLWTLTLGFVVLTGGPARSQPTVPERVVRVQLPEQVTGSAGSIVRVKVSLQISDGWHVNAHPASMEALIPTRVSIADTKTPVSLVSAEYPPGRDYKFEFADQPLTVYEGRVEVSAFLRLGPRLEPGTYELPMNITYQACDDTRCLRPRTVNRAMTIRVNEGSSAGAQSWPTVWSSSETQTDEGYLAGTFRRGGLLPGLVLVFILGLSLNLTPCVYPMIPITVGYFGGREEAGLSRRLLDACFFVLGMALIYAILGALAGLGGSMLGDALQSPRVQLGLAGLMVLMSGSMFGFYELKLPEPIRKQSESLGKALGTFGMGMTLGVVAAPCLAPSTVALLGFVGQLGNIWAGAGLFFVLALGLGLPYVVLAVFSSQLHRLPGSGQWMDWVKSVLGFMILGVAVYFLWPMLTNTQFAYVMGGLVLVSMAVLSVIQRPETTRAWLVRTAGVLVVGLTLLVLLGWTFLWGAEPIRWTPAAEVIAKDGLKIKRPTVVYVGASWCVPCKEMELTTFRNSELRSRFHADVVPVKVDLSTSPSSTIQGWLKDREVLGVPTIMFFNPGKGELRFLRLEGYVGADKLLQHIERLRNSQRTKSTE